MIHLAAILVGALADHFFGDPHGFPHIVVGIGKLISVLERFLRRILRKSPSGELAGGIILAVAICVMSFGASWGILYLCSLIDPLAALLAESFMCWQCLSLRSLKVESMSVHSRLISGDLAGARRAVSMIVGRDTQRLDEEGVTRATVETVAENAGDGVIAPLIYMALGGAPLGVLFKAINTMDSMIGYRNERYLYFGRAGARLDDAANFIPSRAAALLMVISSPIAGLDGKSAWRIFRRDRYNHKSPNSAQTESACAGALHIRLGGDSYYFGKLVNKPTIGDDDRRVEPEDIRRANRLVFTASMLCLFLCALIRGLIIWL